MTNSLSIALAQLNPTVGDIAGNLDLVRESRRKAAHADLIVCPELVLIGYPPEDLVLRPAVIDAIRAGVEALAPETSSGPAIVVTAPWRDGAKLHNAALLLDEGRIAAIRYKHELPNYGVFDEKRVFAPGPLPEPIDFRGVRLGVMICEDMWYPTVGAHLASRNADLLLVPNGSPFERTKLDQRISLAAMRVRETARPLVYVNQVGGQDELVFDGGSFVLNADAELALRMPVWKEQVGLTQWCRRGATWTCVRQEPAPLPSAPANTYQALMLGLRDYVNKNRFPGVLLGLSGGIDSALTAVVAVDALGVDRVRAVRLPSRFTSEESQVDAEACARRLGIALDTVAIAGVVEAAEQTLSPIFAGRPRDITEE